MRSVVLRSLAVIGVGAALLVGVLYVASTVDARPPEVLEIRLTQPLADDLNRALITTSLEIVFNEEVEPDGAAEALRIEPSVDGSVSWSGTTMIFTPADLLQLATAYEVSFDEGIRDLAGNEMATLPAPFDFETAGRPSVAETVPDDGETGVAVDEPIGLRFSTLMDTASVETALRLLPTFAHDLRWSGELLEIVPAEPLRADREYAIRLGPDATDVAGVPLGEAFTLSFRTIEPGLRVEALVPADGIEGIATTSPIAVILDRPVDPGSVSAELLAIDPEVAGTLEVAALTGDEPADDGSGRVLRFTPSAPLPANTTFSVTLAPGIAAVEGGGLPEAIAWTFTTGAPSAALSNQVTFLSDRAGVTNVWAMNADGTSQRQLSVELAPVLDYAVAPDGTSLVVADGHRLVFSRPDGSERRVLTADGFAEFDPAYHPGADRLAFARADAESGEPLGLWEWEVGGGDPVAIELPPDFGGPDPSGEGSAPVRAPRYAPDGQALAFVDAAGSVGILELPAERLTRVDFAASAAPSWLPGSATILLTGIEEANVPAEVTFTAPVAPLAPTDDSVVVRLNRSGITVTGTPFGVGARVVAIGPDGSIAYVDADGALWLTDSPNTIVNPPLIGDEQVGGAAFAPGEPAIVIVAGAAGPREPGRIELVSIGSGERVILATGGWHLRWLP